ncbi:hypothetical protein [Paraburkholderia caribensis]|uniref:hypothetical protein n=1 Tax=Paraburkholderia caribensis TaxID=75105 RepID=UPI00078D99BA|nr:hypothetical protein [Paraburkholderia caribensis]AMV41738.1 hypothetical protein ATN79_03445 [Paraburkholderia caribensis]
MSGQLYVFVNKMSKKKRKVVTPRISTPAQPKLPDEKKAGVRGAWTFLAGSGILALLLAGAYQYVEGSVSLEFVQALGRGYEFQIKNATPADKIITRFRVVAPPRQRLIYHITENTYAQQNPDGKVELPGGNLTYIPAVEYREFDGRRISANSDVKFRVPPLSDRPWMEPDAAIFSIRYEVESSNPMLSSLEHALNRTGLRSNDVTIRYLVVNNYWIPTNSDSPGEAIRIFCRDNEDLASAATCRDAEKAAVAGRY